MSHETSTPEKQQFLGAYARQFQFATVFVGVAFLCVIAYMTAGLFVAMAFGATSAVFYAVRAFVRSIPTARSESPIDTE